MKAPGVHRAARAPYWGTPIGVVVLTRGINYDLSYQIAMNAMKAPGASRAARPQSGDPPIGVVVMMRGIYYDLEKTCKCS